MFPMQLTPIDYALIRDCLPRQRGNVSHDNLRVLNGIIHMLENGCKWRALPKEFGNWHTVYTRMNRWSKNGVLHRVFDRLQREGLMNVLVRVMSLDSTSIRVHPDGTGALKKTDPNPSAARAGGAPPNFIWLPLMRVAQPPSASRRVRMATHRGGAN